MLLNILHTIAITCAVGTNFYIRPQKNNLPNRTNTEYTIQSNVDVDMQTISLGGTQHLYVIENENETIGTWNTLQKGTITGTKLYGQTIKLKTNGWYENGEGEGGSLYEVATGYNNTNPTHKVEWRIDENNWSNQFYPTMQLDILKIESVGTTTQTTLNIRENVGFLNNMLSQEYWNFTQYTNTEKKLLIDYFITNSNNLESIFTTQQTQTIIKNKNAYDTYEELMYKAGYTSNRIIKNIALSYENEERYNEGTNTYYTDVNYYKNISENIGLYPNGTTYLVMFTQVYLNLTNNNTLYYAGDTAELENRDTTVGKTATINGVLVINPTTTEIVDIPGTMIYILGMPFTFISTAFNLTIFPGTPYQVNLSMLFLAILGVLVFVFLLKIILNAVGKA